MTRDPIDVAQGYNRWAATYDAMANRTRDQSMARLRAWTAHYEGRDVLELGCGTGLNTEHLAMTAGAVTALDFSDGMLGEARARLARAEVRFLQHDLATPLPLADESFDVVVESLVLEHIEDVAPVFAEVARVLRPGGQFLMSELHPYKQLQGGQARFVEDGGETPIVAFRHTIAEFVNAAVDAGLTIAELLEEEDPGKGPRLFSLRAAKG